MNAFSSAIGAVAEESAVTAAASARSSPAAETTAAPASTAKSAASRSSGSRTSTTAEDSPSGSCLPGLLLLWVEALAAQSARTGAGERSPNPKVILPVLQPVAESPIDQKGFVGVSGSGARVGRRRGFKLVQLIRGHITKTFLPLLRPLRDGLRRWLEFQRPLRRLGTRSDLKLALRVLKTEHLDFQRICARGQIRKVVLAGFIRSCQYSTISLGSDHGGSRNRLTAELHHARLRAQDSQGDQNSQE